MFYLRRRNMWTFIQDQILGMKWLNVLIQNLLAVIGIDTSSKIGGSITFFIYDVIKISVLLCVLIFVISYIQSFFPPERSKRILGRFHGIGANLISALLGTVTPFCSCSSIPLFMGFTSAGLPLGVTFSFLISSPMVDLGSLVLLMSIFGVKVAIVYVVLGLVIAVVGGSIIEKLHLENQVEGFIRNASSVEIDTPSLTQKERLIYAKDQVVETFKKVILYILVGVAIGAIIHNWIPESWVINVLGNRNPLGVVLATVVGVPMYADIFGTIPIAESLLGKGAQLGTVLSFMMAVTTLSLPSMIMLKKAIKPKLLGVFIAICVIGIVLVGYLFNVIQFILL
ncbi:MAG: permease [Saccharofermentans sp.]|nr:permease [Saccharofermentans sp.]